MGGATTRAPSPISPPLFPRIGRVRKKNHVLIRAGTSRSGANASARGVNVDAAPPAVMLKIFCSIAPSMRIAGAALRCVPDIHGKDAEISSAAGRSAPTPHLIGKGHLRLSLNLGLIEPNGPEQRAVPRSEDPDGLGAPSARGASARLACGSIHRRRNVLAADHHENAAKSWTQRR